MSGRITVTGLVSGIDFNSIISQLIQIERDQRIAPLERSLQTNAERIAKLQEFSSLIGAVKSAAAKLNTVSGARPKTATSSDTNKIRIASVGSNALTGAYPLTQVRKLAQGEILASTTTLGSGAIAEQSYTFAVKSNGTQRTVTTVDFSTIDDEDELGQLATDINQDAGDIVNAFVVNSGTSNARLMIVAKNTGSTLGGGDALSGAGQLGDVAFSLGSGGADSATRTMFYNLQLVSGAYGGGSLTLDSQEGNSVQNNLDLSLSVGNVAFSFDTNSVSTLIPGVGLEFLSTFNTGTVTVTVNNDTAALQDNIQSLVDAVNDVQTFVKEQTTFDQDTQKAGILQSDSAVRQMRDAMIAALGLDVVGQPKSYRNAPDVGLEFDRTGVLLFDTSDLQTKMASSFSDVGELFRGYKFTSDNFTKTGNDFTLGTVSMSFNIKGITINVSGTVTAGDNDTELKSLRDIINEDGRGILNAKVIEQPDGTIRLALYGDNILYNEDVASLSSGAAEVNIGLVASTGSKSVKNTSPGIASYLEDQLKDLINGTGTAAGIIESEIDQLGDLNFFYNQRIQTQEDYIAGIEDRLKKKFTALESVLANFQSQGDFLASRSGLATGK